MLRTCTPKQPATAFDKRKTAAFSPAFMPPRLFSSCPTHSPPHPLIFSLRSAPLLVSFLPLPPSPTPWPLRLLVAPHANAASPCFVALTTLKTSGPPNCPTESHPLHARETKNPGEPAARRRHLHPIPTPPTSPQCLSSSFFPSITRADRSYRAVEAAMKSPPVMDPEAPPPPGTPPYDDEVWWAGGRSCLVFQRSNLVGAAHVLAVAVFLESRNAHVRRFSCDLGPEMC